jgi:hypothetical protein
LLGHHLGSEMAELGASLGAYKALQSAAEKAGEGGKWLAQRMPTRAIQQGLYGAGSALGQCCAPIEPRQPLSPDAQPDPVAKDRNYGCNEHWEGHAYENFTGDEHG